MMDLSTKRLGGMVMEYAAVACSSFDPILCVFNRKLLGMSKHVVLYATATTKTLP